MDLVLLVSYFVYKSSVLLQTLLLKFKSTTHIKDEENCFTQSIDDSLKNKLAPLFCVQLYGYCFTHCTLHMHVITITWKSGASLYRTSLHCGDFALGQVCIFGASL